VTEPLFSIITCTNDDAAGLRLTAKSIAVQQQFTNYEWLVLDHATDEDIIAEYKTEMTKWLPVTGDNLYLTLNVGIEQATGRYIWFLNPGDCLSDAYVLRDVAKQIQYNLAPDFIYGDARDNGKIKKAHHAGNFTRGKITAFQAMIFRRTMVAELRFDPAYSLAADYAFMLGILARAKKIFYFPRILCDSQSSPVSELSAKGTFWENYYIRRDLLQINPVRNKMIFYLDRIKLFIYRSTNR